MCIFSNTVEKIKQTNILVYETQDKRQVTVYSNEVELSNLQRDKPNAMILPVPCKGMSVNSIQLLNLSGVPKLFSDLDDILPMPEEEVELIDFSPDDTPKSLSLTIKRVGGYLVSIAYDVNELDAINKSKFEIRKPVLDLLKRMYKEGYSFIVCKFEPNVTKITLPHPLAYVHTKIAPDLLFVPTLHYHSDEHDDSIYATEYELFDHDIYSFNIGNRATEQVPPEEKWSGSGPKPKLKKAMPSVTRFTSLDVNRQGSKRNFLGDTEDCDDQWSKYNVLKIKRPSYIQKLGKLLKQLSDLNVPLPKDSRTADFPMLSRESIHGPYANVDLYYNIVE